MDQIRHIYTIQEINLMRPYAARDAQRLLKYGGFKPEVDTNINETVMRVLRLSEDILQNYIIAGITYKELEVEGIESGY